MCKVGLLLQHTYEVSLLLVKNPGAQVLTPHIALHTYSESGGRITVQIL